MPEGLNASFKSLEQHESGIHAVRSELQPLAYYDLRKLNAAPDRIVISAPRFLRWR